MKMIALCLLLVLASACTTDPVSTTDAAAHDAGPANDAPATPRDSDVPPIDAPPIDAPRADGGPLPDDLTALIAAMPSGSWLALPGSDMSAACPGSGSYACWAVLGAWGGGTYDVAGDRMLIWGGGHNDSHLNNLFVYDVRERAWRRETEMPAGIDADTVPESWRQIELESCGYYPRTSEPYTVPTDWLIPETGYIRHELCTTPEVRALYDDQQPRSRHTYGYLVFDPAENRFCSLGSAGGFPSGQTGTSEIVCYDFDDRRWSPAGENPYVSVNSTSAVDDHGRAWYLSGATANVLAYDFATGESTEHASTLGVSGTAAIDTLRQRVVVAGPDGAIVTLDLASPDALVDQAHTGSAAIDRFPGFDYAASEDRFYAWDGGTAVYALDPETFAWTAIPTTGDDPGPSMSNGTYGRFRWAPNLGVFVLVNAASSYTDFGGHPHVFFFKP
jgi:hypothetical protein